MEEHLYFSQQPLAYQNGLFVMAQYEPPAGNIMFL